MTTKTCRKTGIYRIFGAAALCSVLSACELQAVNSAAIYYNAGPTYDAITLDHFMSNDILYSAIFSESVEYSDYTDYSVSQSVAFSVSDGENTVAAQCTVTEQETVYAFSALHHSAEALASCDFLDYSNNEHWQFSGYGTRRDQLEGDVTRDDSRLSITHNTHNEAHYDISSDFGTDWRYYNDTDIVEWTPPINASLILATTTIALYLFDHLLLEDSEHVYRAPSKKIAGENDRILI